MAAREPQTELTQVAYIGKSKIVETAVRRSVGTAPPAPMRQGKTKGAKNHE